MNEDGDSTVRASAGETTQPSSQTPLHIDPAEYDQLGTYASIVAVAVSDRDVQFSFFQALPATGAAGPVPELRGKLAARVIVSPQTAADLLRTLAQQFNVRLERNEHPS